jgi:ADP-glucose pyrophosphorylase
MKYFSFLSALVKIERILILLCIIMAGFFVWQNQKIENAVTNQEAIIQQNLEKEFAKKVQQLPSLLPTPSSNIQLEEFNVFNKNLQSTTTPN